MGERVLNTVE